MELYNLYKDNVIFQQNLPFNVRGIIKDSASLSITLINETKKVSYTPSLLKFEKNEFIAYFKPQKGSYDSYKIILKGDKEEIIVNNVHFGDVFFFAGQSNVSYCLSALEENEKYVSKVEKQNIYCFDIKETDQVSNPYEVKRPVHPQKNHNNNIKWVKLDSKNSGLISGLSVLTTSLYADKKDYPIGFVHTAMGGLPIESYIPKSEVEHDDFLVQVMKSNLSYYDKDEEYNNKGGRNYAQLGGVFNEKVSPLKGFYFKTFIWYLGESACYDYQRARYFKKCLKILLKFYRTFFEQPKLQILVTGIADDFYPYADFMSYCYINEAEISLEDKNTTFIPIHDVESRWLDENNKDIYYHPIHPRNKEMIAYRYVQSIENPSLKYPKITNAIANRNKLTLTINSINGFKIGSSFDGFCIAGEDNIYFPAEAVVTNKNEITLVSKYVVKPMYCTYAFTQHTFLCDGCDLKGMPLLPFRSKNEPISRGTYLTNECILSCDNLTIRESNFGYDVGGGFFTDIFEQSNIFHTPIDISLDKKNFTQGKASLLIKANPVKALSYYYFAVKMNIGLSGAKHNLDKFHYLLIDLKSDQECEFQGIAFRKNGVIYKLPIVDKNNNIVPFIKVSGSFKTYAIDLSRFLDGSGCVYTCKGDLANIESFDIYFRHTQLTKVNIDNIITINSLEQIAIGEVSSKEEKSQDSSNLIMKK